MFYLGGFIILGKFGVGGFYFIVVSKFGMGVLVVIIVIKSLG